MVSLTGSFFPLIVAALLSIIEVDAGPSPAYAKHSTHRKHAIGKRDSGGFEFYESYHPPSTFTIYDKLSGQTEAPSPNIRTLGGAAKSFLSIKLGINESDIEYTSGFTEGKQRMAYVKQSINGIPVANAVGNVAFNGDRIYSYATSFVADVSSAPSCSPSVPWESGLSKIEERLQAKHNKEHGATLEYLVKRDQSIILTYVIQVQNEATGAWYEAFINAHTGALASVTNFVAHASYTVVPANKQSLSDGLETVVNPADKLASPKGWHVPIKDFKDVYVGTASEGNNVYISKRLEDDSILRTKLSTTNTSDFNSVYDDSRSPYDKHNHTNFDAAMTNSFYITNVMHDFSYRYGFTEDKFNFQNFNYNGGSGKESDAVQVEIQSVGSNDASFATPPDGQAGVCRMFTWQHPEVPIARDGAMSNDVLIHELTHGITNRLTGGGTARCLQTLEAGGLGEGWADSMASWMSQNTNTTEDFAFGTYLNNGKNMRRFPYSTNPKTNPLMYNHIATDPEMQEVHGIGEVWANILHQVYAALVNKHGFTSKKLTNPESPAGNVVYMHLFMDALSLQPCNPTFVAARDAWYAADRTRYNGANFCLLSAAFASRGLGADADGTYTNNYKVQPGCASYRVGT